MDTGEVSTHVHSGTSETTILIKCNWLTQWLGTRSRRRQQFWFEGHDCVVAAKSMHVDPNPTRQEQLLVPCEFELTLTTRNALTNPVIGVVVFSVGL